MYYILVVCTGNTCRSPMAEALLKTRAKHEGQADILILSAGLATVDGLGASEGAQKAMDKRGIALSEHCSRQIKAEFTEQADLILTMTAAHKTLLLQRMPSINHKLFTLAEYADEDDEAGDVAHPYGGSDIIYEKAAQQIEKFLDKAWGKIVLKAGNES